MSEGWTKGLIDWLRSPANLPFLAELNNDIRDRAVQAEHDALQPGDTEYKKGYAAALRFAADLPAKIVEPADQAETVS